MAKLYCSHALYLSEKHKDVLDLFTFACMEHLLKTPRAGGSGRTLLIPSAATVKKIQGMLFDGSPDTVSKGQDLLAAHVLRNGYLEPADFTRSGLPPLNSEQPRSRKMVVKGIEGSKVVLSNGAELERASDFRGCAKGVNISVYNVSKGEVPTDGELMEERKRPMGMRDAAKKGSSVKRGGADPVNDIQLRQFAANVEALAIGASSVAKFVGAFMAPAYSFVEFCLDRDDDAAAKSQLACIIPRLAGSPFDFWIVFDAHNSKRLLHLGLFNSWLSEWNAKPKAAQCSANVSAFFSRVDGWLASAHSEEFGAAAVFSRRAELLDAIDRMRGAALQGHPTSYASNVSNQLKALVSTNEIPGCRNVFPAELIAYYRANPCRLQIETDLRAVLYYEFKQYAESFATGKQPQMLHNALDYISANMKANCSTMQLAMLNPAINMQRISSSQMCNFTRLVIRSTYGPFFVYLTAGDHGDYSSMKEKASDYKFVVFPKVR